MLLFVCYVWLLYGDCCEVLLFEWIDVIVVYVGVCECGCGWVVEWNL